MPTKQTALVAGLVVVSLAVTATTVFRWTRTRPFEVTVRDAQTGMPVAGQTVQLVYSGIFLTGMPEFQLGQTDAFGKVTLVGRTAYVPTLVIYNDLLQLDLELLEAGQAQSLTRVGRTFSVTIRNSD